MTRKTYTTDIGEDELNNRIEQAVAAAITAERRRTRELLIGLISELQKTLDGKFERALAVIDRLGQDIRVLNERRPDARGVVRRQCFTPQTH
jgi:hypothetical protein